MHKIQENIIKQYLRFYCWKKIQKILLKWLDYHDYTMNWRAYRRYTMIARPLVSRFCRFCFCFDHGLFTFYWQVVAAVLYTSNSLCVHLHPCTAAIHELVYMGMCMGMCMGECMDDVCMGRVYGCHPSLTIESTVLDRFWSSFKQRSSS